MSAMTVEKWTMFHETYAALLLLPLTKCVDNMKTRKQQSGNYHNTKNVHIREQLSVSIQVLLLHNLYGKGFAAGDCTKTFQSTQAQTTNCAQHAICWNHGSTIAQKD